MTRLVTPSLDLYETWRDTVAEMSPGHLDGSGHWHLPTGAPRLTPGGCAEAVAELARWTNPAVAERAQLVASDYLWITDDDSVVVGFLAVRHRLNEWLFNEGGHIGYSVRPSRRREGHAGAALALGVRRAAELGIDRVLVCCEADNEASRRTIERNGGRFEDQRNTQLRYWISS